VNSSLRRCPQCGRFLFPGDFAMDNSKGSGFASRCRDCDRERCRQYYAEHREERLAAKARARAQAPPRICERCDQPATSSRHHYCDACRAAVRLWGKRGPLVVVSQ
jgi:hypothetical protein